MRQAALVLLVFLTALLHAPSSSTQAADSTPGSRVTISPGLAIPQAEELKRKVEQGMRQPSSRLRSYTRQGDRWVEIKPAPPRNLSAVVRSYDEKERSAHVYLVDAEYRMPVLQIWRFDGKAWSDSIDPGIFIR